MEEVVKEKNETSISFGIASLVVSIIGLLMFLMPYFGIVFSILAIVFANVQNKKNKSGMATAGLVVGIIGTVSNAIWLLFVLLFLMIAGF